MRDGSTLLATWLGPMEGIIEAEGVVDLETHNATAEEEAPDTPCIGPVLTRSFCFCGKAGGGIVSWCITRDGALVGGRCDGMLVLCNGNNEVHTLSDGRVGDGGDAPGAVTCIVQLQSLAAPPGMEPCIVSGDEAGGVVVWARHGSAGCNRLEHGHAAPVTCLCALPAGGLASGDQAGEVWTSLTLTMTLTLR